MADEKVVNEGTPDQPLSALESAVASSPEGNVEAKQPVQEAEAATPKEEATQEPVAVEEEGRIPYSRFKEKVDEANWLKQQLELTIQQRQQQLSIQQPLQDPYAGMSAEERVFWQGIDKRIQDSATQIADARVRQISPVIDAGRMELAQMKVQQFRVQHPDIKSNSPEEMDIAQKIQQGYTPDDAYWAVMGPRGIRVAVQQEKQQAKQQIAAKKMANIETSVSVNRPSVEIPKTIPKTASERFEQQRSSIQRFRDDLKKRLDASMGTP